MLTSKHRNIINASGTKPDWYSCVTLVTVIWQAALL